MGTGSEWTAQLHPHPKSRHTTDNVQLPVVSTVVQFEKVIRVQLVAKNRPFMRHGSLLPCSQHPTLHQPTLGTIPGQLYPVHLHILFKIKFNMSHIRYGLRNVLLSLDFPTNIVTHFSSPSLPLNPVTHPNPNSIQMCIFQHQRN